MSSRRLSKIDQQIAEHWDRRIQTKRPDRINWWESRAIRQHINRYVAGAEYGGTGEGLVHVFKERLGGTVLPKAVSVGAGIGNKEMRFVRMGLVERFDLYELSAARIARGRKVAENLGLTDQVHFYEQDAFECVADGSVDLVHWNNSLHHMLDVHQAMEWSARVLKPGGHFFMDDFVGPSRFQWSERSLQIASGVRASLPRRFLSDPQAPADAPRDFDIQVRRPSARRIAREDPSEAADSGRILGAVAEVFPDADIRRTGGLVYHLALTGIIHNFDEDDEQDLERLRVLLDFDRSCAENPELESPYAVALARKPGLRQK